LPYTAATPGYDNWRIKVKDTKTGKIQWMPCTTYFSQFATSDGMGGPTGNERYVEIYGVPTVWIVQVNDNWKNVGQIYVNDATGEILKVTIDGKTLENIMPQGNQTSENVYTSANSTDIIDTTDQIPQDTLYPGLTLLAVLSILIIAGAGYWFYRRK